MSHENPENLNIPKGSRSFDVLGCAPRDITENVIIGQITRNLDLNLAQIGSKPRPGLAITLKSACMLAMSLKKFISPIIPSFAFAKRYLSKLLGCSHCAFRSGSFCFVRIFDKKAGGFSNYLFVFNSFNPPVGTLRTTVKRGHESSVPSVPFGKQIKSLFATLLEV